MVRRAELYAIRRLPGRLTAWFAGGGESVSNSMAGTPSSLPGCEDIDSILAAAAAGMGGVYA